MAKPDKKAARPEEAAAELLIKYVSELNPLWAERLRVAAEENHWTPLQQFGIYVARVLDRAEHMTGVPHPAFEVDAPRTPPRMRCAYEPCGKRFAPQWPGQKTCGPECTELLKRSSVPFAEPPPTSLA